mgnify:CR=1 FL=1
MNKEHDIRNKFASNPNVYKFNLDDKYVGIYDGLDKKFWKGYYQSADKNVLCFIEEAQKHRVSAHSNKERAFNNKEDTDNYINNDKIFKISPMHPKHHPINELKLIGK